MEKALSLPPKDDLDTLMLKVARDLAMDIYPLKTILDNNGITWDEMKQWYEHPRFLGYLQSESEAWKDANNTAERTKLKAAVVMEMFMQDAYANLQDKKQPLNHRVELGKLIAKIAGMGEPKVFGANGNAPAFQLQINIGPDRTNNVTIRPEMGRIMNYDDAPVREAIPSSEEDDYDPLVSPTTLEE